jgi:hypothetical protein
VIACLDSCYFTLDRCSTLGITVATQGVGAIATNAAMVQMVVTPTDGQQIGGMVKNKIQGMLCKFFFFFFNSVFCWILLVSVLCVIVFLSNLIGRQSDP